MNKIFKVIWNHTTQSWVAVSELTSAKGKTKSKTAAKLTALSLVAGSALMAGNAMGATAAVNNPVIDSSSVVSNNTNNNFAIATNGGKNVTATSWGNTAPKNVIYIGNGSTPGIGDEDILIGNDMRGSNSGLGANTLIGNHIYSGGSGSRGLDTLSTAVGYAAQVAGPSVSMGIGALSDIGDSGGYGAVAQGAVSVGAFSVTSGNVNGGTAVGTMAYADQTDSVSLGLLSGASNTGRSRLATADGINNIAINEANGSSTLTSLGSRAAARSTGGIAIGSRATTSSSTLTRSDANGVAVGTNSASIKNGSIAVGNAAIAGGYSDTDITSLTAERTRLQGLLDTQRTRLQTFMNALSEDATAENQYNFAAAMAATDRIQVALDRVNADLTRAAAGSAINTTNAMAFGNAARAANANAQAMGTNSVANGANSVANGANARAMGDNAVAMGNGATSGMTAAQWTTYNTYLTAANSFTTASNNLATQLTNWHYQLGKLNDNDIQYLRDNNISFNDPEAIMALSNPGLEAARNLSSRMSNLIGAARNLVNAQTAYTNAQTAFNTARDNARALTPAIGTIAIGNTTSVAADNAVALGNNITIENDTKTENDTATITANRQNAVVLGNNSSGNPTVKAVNSATVGNYTYSGFAGNLGGTDTNGNPVNAADTLQGRFVSIGSTGSERQIKHVAAGEISATSTDAINGSQLYLVAHKLGNGPVVYTDAAGNKLTQAADGNWYPSNAVIGPDGKYYPAGTTFTNDGTPSQAALTGIPSSNVIASMNNPTNSTDNTAGNAYNLTNIAAGANTMAFDAAGNPLVNINGAYYSAGDVVNGKAKDGATAQTVATTPTAVQAAKTGLADLENSNPTNAFTVADAKNLGWVVSTDNTLTDKANGTSTVGTAYASAVKNANEVHFQGTGIATVSGATIDGVQTINVHVDAQAVSESAQNPVVYTTADGTKLTKVGDNFYPANAVVNNGNRYPADSVVIGGKVYPKGTTQDQVNAGTATEATPLTATPVANVIASMNNAGNSTTTPMALSNVGAGAKTFDAVDKDGNQLVKIGDNYYPAGTVEINGKAYPAGTTADQVTAGTAKEATASTATPLALANDGKWYDATKIDPNGQPQAGTTTETTLPKNVGTSGLVDFANSNPNNAATVKDLQNMGWVISTSDNEYEDQVRNANKVDFKGGDGIEVTGKTTKDGTREITIGLKKGEVISTNDASKTGTTTDADDNTVNVVKASDGNWYKAGDVTTTTDENGNAVVTPNEGATAITTTVTTNTDGSGFVTGNQVADAIEASGWNVGKATADTMNKATGDALTADNGKVEKVNPNDNVRYVDGTNITQTLKTATETNADGTTHTTTYIQADLNPNVTLGGAAFDKEGNILVKVGDDYYKSTDVKDGKPVDGAKSVAKDDIAKPAANGSLTVKAENGNTGVDVTVTPDGQGQVSISGSTYTTTDEKGNEVTKTAKADIIVDRGPAAVDTVKAEDGKFYHPADVTVDPTTGKVTANKDAKPVDGTMDRVSYVDSTNNVHDLATMNDGLNFTGDDGSIISKPLNSTVGFTGGNRTTVNVDGTTTSAPIAKADTTTGNIGVFNDNGKMSIQLAKDLQGMNSATFGGDNNSAQTVINGNGVTVNPAGNTDPANAVSVTTNGVNAGNQRVTNVAPGRIAADSKDAVNGSQLYGITQNVNNLGNKVDRMDKDLRAGVAGANAAAGLPQVYLPGKSMVAASAGTFKGQNAVAIGYSRASDNGKVIFKLQGNANSQGDVGGSVGVGYQW